MSTSQITTQFDQSGGQRCEHCGMVLPLAATFCGKCGAHVEESSPYTKDVSSIDGHADLEQYRITSLIRRTPYVQLSLATDTRQQRSVVIRDIDIQQIDISSRPHIFEALQQEYDLLRRQNMDNVLPLVASFHTQDHLYSVSAWPPITLPQKSKDGQTSRIYTLQDLLQSGIGLPDEHIALNWILLLTNAVEHLHKNNIVIGTLDPSIILVSQKDYSGEPMLFPSWMLPVLQPQSQQASAVFNAAHISHIPADRTAFFSPEAKEGLPEMRSDIYSMGAILYLLVTGIAPIEQGRTASQQFRSPREINPRVQHTLATTILTALEREPSARFHSANEFAAALLQRPEQSKAPQRLYKALLGHHRSAEKAGTQPEEINATSDKDNTKTEQGEAVQANSETNDDTVPIGHTQTQSAKHYLPQVKAQKLGQEQLNSDHEDSMVENGFLEPTVRLVKKDIQRLQSEYSATGVETVPGPEDETSVQNKSDNTDSSNKDEQNTDTMHVSNTTDPEEAPNSQTTDADTKQTKQIQDDSTAVSSESHERIPITEQPTPHTAATEATTNIENTSSSRSNIEVLDSLPSPSEVSEVSEQDRRDFSAPSKTSLSLLQRIKRFVLGGQPRINNLVAIIETPMRIQPNTNYTIRIHLMGRNEPKHAHGLKQNNDVTVLKGLGSLVHGEHVHIEVRSALYHNYAYIVQQADVEVPAHNYAAEITIPMRSITGSPGTKRERLHIFFTDEKHNPLYEKPFLIELFISNLVQSGEEGHNVLSIPL